MKNLQYKSISVFTILLSESHLVPNKCLKYPKQGGHEHVHEANDDVHPQQ